MKRGALIAAMLVSGVAAGSAGCGSSSGPALPTIAAAQTYELKNFTPAGPVTAGRPAAVGLTIQEPSGAAILRYRKGGGPHTGVDLIIVPTDLRSLIYEDPPIGEDGSIREAVTFPAAGSYRVVVDAFPDTPGVPANVQLFETIRVNGAPAPPPPRFGHTNTTGGYRFAIQGKPKVRTLEPAFLTIKVTDAHGAPVSFSPFDGALAHAVFFREGSLAYVHTHICAPNVPACASTARGPVGSATKPGVLRVGALLPVSGRWRMFLRTKIKGRELVTPFTLVVR